MAHLAWSALVLCLFAVVHNVTSKTVYPRKIFVSVQAPPVGSLGQEEEDDEGPEYNPEFENPRPPSQDTSSGGLPDYDVISDPMITQPMVNLDIQPNKGDGTYSYSYLTTDGRGGWAKGWPGPKGTVERGEYWYPTTDGFMVRVSYIADESGYHPVFYVTPMSEIPVSSPGPVETENIPSSQGTYEEPQPIPQPMPYYTMKNKDVFKPAKIDPYNPFLPLTHVPRRQVPLFQANYFSYYP